MADPVDFNPFVQVFLEAYPGVFPPGGPTTTPGSAWLLPPVSPGAPDFAGPRCPARAAEFAVWAVGLYRRLSDYREHMIGQLGLGLADVEAYLRAQRSGLAAVHAAACENPPSAFRVQTVVYRFATNARRAPAPPRHYTFRRADGGWEWGEYPPGAHRSTALGPPDGYRRVSVPHAAALLDACVERIDAPALLETVEAIFGGPPDEVIPGPTPGDRQVPSPAPAGAHGPAAGAKRFHRPRPSAEAVEAILTAIQEAGRPLSRSALADRAGYTKGTIGHYVVSMMKEGRLCHTPDGYALPDVNQTHVA
jgi:hypothetical protein